MVFKTLASGSSGNCYHLSGGGAKKPLLLDAGIPFKRIQIGIGFQVHMLAGCLVTHSHGDHCKAVADLIYAGVDVYASNETFEVLERFGNDRRLVRDYRFKTVKDRQPFRVGDWCVVPFEVPHDCPGSLGFMIGSPNGDRALYLTDAAYSPVKFEGLTHIFIECNWTEDELIANRSDGQIDPARFERVIRTHMSLERLLELLKANDLSKLKEVHLLHVSQSNADPQKIKKAVQRVTGVPVYIEQPMAPEVY